MSADRLTELLRMDADRLPAIVKSQGTCFAADPIAEASAYRWHFLEQYRYNPRREHESESPHPYRWARACALEPVRLPADRKPTNNLHPVMAQALSPWMPKEKAA